MKRAFGHLFFLVLVIAGLCPLQKAIAQSSKRDSLLKILAVQKDDSEKVKTLGRLFTYFENRNPDSARLMSAKELELAGRISWNKGIANAEYDLANYYNDRSQYPESLKHYLASLSIWETAERTANAGEKEKIAYQKMKLYGDIGGIYREENNDDLAMDYYLKGLAASEHFNYTLGIGRQFNNIGLLYKRKKDFNSALDYYQRALSAFIQTKSRKDEAITWGNMGNVYLKMGRSDSALACLQRSLRIKEQISNRNGIAVSYCNIGNVYFNLKQYATAKDYFNRGIALADSVRATALLREIHKYYADMDSILGDYKGSLEHYKKYIAANDSIVSAANTKLQTQTEMQYEFGKRSATDSIKNAEATAREKLQHDNEIRQQQLYTWAGAGGFALMLVVAVISIRAFRNKKKANELISHQKELVEEKQREIIDSIRYAKRIQQSLLPNEKTIYKNLNRN